MLIYRGGRGERGGTWKEEEGSVHGAVAPRAKAKVLFVLDG